MKPAVGFDLSPLGWAPPSGISYYACHLTRELEKLELPFRPLYYFFSHRPLALEFPTADRERTIRFAFPMRAAKKIWDYRWGQKLLGLSRADLFFATNSELPRLSKRQKKVLVLHDLASLRLDGIYSGYFLTQRLGAIRQGIERADRVVVYSRATQADLCDLFSFPEDKCKIIPLGVEAEFFGGKDDKESPARPYFFSNGMVQPRKNFATLARAFLEAVKEVRLPHRLLIAGGDGWKASEIKAEIKSIDAENRVEFLGYVSRRELAALYQKATAFLFPSLYEGFGLPVLEAMAAGTPVLTSNTSALPEVAGDAALLVDPLQVKEIRAGISRLASEPELAAELRRRGRKRAARYSFAQTARQTAGFLGEVLGVSFDCGAAPAGGV